MMQEGRIHFRNPKTWPGQARTKTQTGKSAKVKGQKSKWRY